MTKARLNHITINKRTAHTWSKDEGERINLTISFVADKDSLKLCNDDILISIAEKIAELDILESDKETRRRAIDVLRSKRIRI